MAYFAATDTIIVIIVGILIFIITARVAIGVVNHYDLVAKLYKTHRKQVDVHLDSSLVVLS